MVGNDGAFGDCGPIAHPDVVAQHDGFGEWGHLIVLVGEFDVVEGGIHDLDVPRHAHIAPDGDAVKAEDADVGAENAVKSADFKCAVVGNKQVGALHELDRSVNDQRARNGPDAFLHRRGDVVVPFPDFHHAGIDVGRVQDDFSGHPSEFGPAIYV